MKEVDFYFDFASPNAYLSLMAGKELENKLGFKFNIKLWVNYLNWVQVI